ncbi:MAG: hypothetical protein D6744_03555 [Planctomycetota bacterium]|nr:MAG: hypothetical protein D6744_03555 [Planctomycetota bacterium]
MTAAGVAPLLARMDDEVFALLIVAISIFGFIVVVTVIAQQWRKTREAAYNARLKQIMLERGMSAAEIKSVIEATPDSACSPWMGPVARAQHAARKAAGLE